MPHLPNVYGHRRTVNIVRTLKIMNFFVPYGVFAAYSADYMKRVPFAPNFREKESTSAKTATSAPASVGGLTSVVQGTFTNSAGIGTFSGGLTSLSALLNQILAVLGR